MPPTLTTLTNGIDSTCRALQALAADTSHSEAWRYIVTYWGQQLYKQCLRITQDPDLADDACQEALLQIRDGANRFQPVQAGDAEAAAAGWLRTIARRSALGLMRGRSRTLARERRYAASAPQAVSDSDAEAEPGISPARLHAAIAQLPSQQREALVMHYLEGQDYASIANQQGTTAGNARVRVHRGLEGLRRRLAATGCLLTGSAVLAHLQAAPLVHATPAGQAWLGLLATSHKAALPAATIHGGMSTMLKCSLSLAACIMAAGVSAPLIQEAQAAERTENSRSSTAQVTGVIEGMDFGKGVIEMEGNDGKAYRFIPRWIGKSPKDGGGLDETVLKQIHNLRQGATVRVHWIEEEGPRAIKIDLITQGPGSGTVTGTITKLEAKHGGIHLEDDKGGHHFLMPHWRGGMPRDGGGLDQSMLERIREFKVGDKVRIRWTWEERKRVEAIDKA